MSCIASRLALGAGAIVLSAIICSRASLSDGLTVKPVQDPTVKKECGACHMLYPPGLLPARSWTKMMSGLSVHFGENAELDDTMHKTITDYLVANAADAGGRQNKMLRNVRGDTTPERITELPYWKRKHERKGRIAPESLKRRGAKSSADCKACHTRAEAGDFDDD